MNAINGIFLRGGFCTIWITAFLLSFYSILGASVFDNGSPEQLTEVHHMVIFLGIGGIAAIAHSALIAMKLKDEENKA